jgi:hypothetical protein
VDVGVYADVDGNTGLRRRQEKSPGAGNPRGH